MDLSELKPNTANPRKITESKREMLKKSLEAFGDLSGFVYNVKTHRLVGGHQRQLALPGDSKIVIKERHSPTQTGTVAVGYVMVDGEQFNYREVEWDETTEKAANLAANRHGGEFDMDQVDEWLMELRVEGFDIDLTGFGDIEIPEIGIVEMPEISLDKKSNFQQLAFFLTDDQAALVKEAVALVIKNHSDSFDVETNTNKNSNAIELICAEYLAGAR